jgi:murein DD-endopeptidase MepM/ murein hydrolase activator NlpD
MRNTTTWFAVLSIAFCLNFGCKDDGDTCTSGEDLNCGNYEWFASPYILPYPKGTVYRVNQGNNNTCGGHQGAYTYGYDFDMPIGSVIIASRGGVVSEVRTNRPDGENLTLGNENLVKILHADGSTTAYSHMKQHSISVSQGQMIEQGDTLGLSGNSGYTGNFPHLHFHLSSCDEPTNAGCGTILVKFNNTAPNTCGLVQNEFYEAL